MATILRTTRRISPTTPNGLTAIPSAERPPSFDHVNHEILSPTSHQQQNPERMLKKKYKLFNFFELSNNMKNNPLPEIRIRTRTHMLKTYKNTFHASDAVKWLINRGVSADSTEAVYVCNELICGGFIYNAVEEDIMFNDNSDLYRFAVDDVEERPMFTEVQIEAIKVALKAAMKPHEVRVVNPERETMFGSSHPSRRESESSLSSSPSPASSVFQFERNHYNSHVVHARNPTPPTKPGRRESQDKGRLSGRLLAERRTSAEHIPERFLSAEQVSETYVSGFPGNQAVTFFVEKGYVTRRAEGIRLGQLLLDQKFIRGGDDAFKDDVCLYSFDSEIPASVQHVSSTPAGLPTSPRSKMLVRKQTPTNAFKSLSLGSGASSRNLSLED